MGISRIKVILICSVLICSCKSSLISMQNSKEKKTSTYKRLENLIENDSISDFYKLFNDARFNPNYVKDGDGVTLLFDAVTKNNIEVCDFLIKKGANVNFVSPYGTVMHWALENSNINMANFLLDKGYNPKIEKKIKNNKEPLGILTVFLIKKNKKKGEKLFERLINKGMNPRLKDKDGVSTIALAIYFDSVKLLKLLYQHHLDFNSRFTGTTKDVFVVNNYTPLMLSCYLEKPEIVEELIGFKGVNLNLKSKDGKTALDIAKKKNNEAIIKLLTIANNGYK